MTEIAQHFIDQSRRLLTASYLPRIERSIEGLSPENIWWRANAQSNSIGNLLLHLDGNVRQWIVSGIGGAPDVRERQREFDATGGGSGSELVTKLRTTLGEADRILSALDPTTLLDHRRIQSYDVTVMRAIYGVTEHFSLHTGQIILLAKVCAQICIRCPSVCRSPLTWRVRSPVKGIDCRIAVRKRFGACVYQPTETRAC
jgi:uncharacterized protein DUF1572